MKYSGIGGQAVMEGVMMQNKDTYAVAVRKPDHEIDVKVSKRKNSKTLDAIRKNPYFKRCGELCRFALSGHEHTDVFSVIFRGRG